MSAAKNQTHAVGRRKESSARVYFRTPKEGEGQITVNNKPLDQYFPRELTRSIITKPLAVTEQVGKFDIMVRVSGGGTSGQAGAVRHAIARALEKENAEHRPILKKEGFLTRDARAVERKKPGRHKARRSTQFSKR